MDFSSFSTGFAVFSCGRFSFGHRRGIACGLLSVLLATASPLYAFQVTSSIPANSALNVTPGSAITVYFDSAVNTATVNSATFRVRSVLTGFKEGSYSFGSAAATFQPAQAFVPGDEVVVTLSTNIRSSGGTPLNQHAFQFFAYAFGFTSFTTTLGQALGSGVVQETRFVDVDGDGDLDALIANYTCDVWTNNGLGVFFSTGQTFGGGGSAFVVGVEVSDLNGDGSPDAFVSRVNDNSQVWTNDGKGVFFNTGQSLAGSGYARAVAAGDLDGDGDLDVWQNREGICYVWWNDGHGVFSDSGQRLSMESPTGIALGDLDKDGDLDAFVANETPTAEGSDRVWLNNGRGLFTVGAQRLGYANSGDVVLGDLDGDGDLDALAPKFTPGGRVWLNNGAGTFSTGTAFAGYAHVAPALGDLDGDGDLDAVVTEWSSDYTKVWINNGSAQFSDSGLNLDKINTATVDMGDVDGDGDLDILLGNQSGTHNLWMNDNCHIPGADLAITLSGMPEPVALGDTLTYVMTVTNRGPDTATGVVVTDLLSGAVSFSSAWVSQGSYSQNEGRLTCDLGSLANGATACITVQVTTLSSVIVTNWASLVSSSPEDKVPANNTAQTLTSVNPADLCILKSGPTNPVPVGSNMVFAIAVSNTGPFAATQVHVVDPLPVNLAFVSVTSSQGVGSNNAGIVECDLGSLAVGATAAVTVTATVTGWAVTDNVASVSGAELDVSPGNNVASAPIRIPSFTDTETFFLDLQSVETMEWADYDGDGDMDFYMAGITALPDAQYVCKVFRNDGVAGFQDIGIPNLGVTGGAVSWADYDNDGDLDLFVSGEDRAVRHARAVLYRNLGGDTFAATQTIMDVDFDSRPGYHSYPTSSAWGDYDNDGDMDLLFSGFDAAYSNYVKILRNDQGVLTELASNLAPIDVHAGDTGWSDYDRDGDWDFMMVGSTFTNIGYGFVTESRLYRNDGNGTFAVIPAYIPAMKGELAWGDYDNDSYPDIFIAGHNQYYEFLSQIYRNNGGATFSDINAGLRPVGASEFACVDWGDMDNDGRLDALLVGVVGITVTPHRLSRVYHNDGGNSFTDIEAGLLGLMPGSARWADYDCDGDLDIMIVGDSLMKLYRNDLNISNLPPAAPAGLVSSVSGYDVTLAWQAASDPETPGGGLTYNVRVGTTPGGSEICSAQATPSGIRLLHAMGNAEGKTNLYLKGCAEGAYFWSVQTIDSTYAGSPFATEAQFQVNPSASQADLVLQKTADLSLVPYRSNLVYTLLVSNRGPDSANAVQVADPLPINLSFVSATASQGSAYNSAGTVIGELGTLAVGSTATVVVHAVGSMLGAFTNSALVTSSAVDTNAADNVASASARVEPFTEVPVPIPDLQVADRAWWGDYDRDGHLDFCFTGVTSLYTTLIYRNCGGGVFTNANASLIFSLEGSAAWGDYDNDGDLDLVVSGEDSVQDRTRAVLYRNDAGSFVSAQTLMDVPFVEPPYRGFDSATAWGDCDNDGDLDLALAGTDAASNRVLRIFRNNGGTLADSGIPLASVEARMAEWVDYDADGDLDLFLIGYQSSTYRFLFYRNDGSNVFTSITPAITPVDGDFSWGDYDNDGDMDLLMAGHASGFVRHADIYENLGQDQFTNINAGLTPVGGYGATVDWGDFDGDGDLDVLLAGISPTRITKVYENRGGGVFQDIGATLTGFKPGLGRWGDYDGDNDLDFIMAGDASVSLFRNELNPAAPPPSAPKGLNAHVRGSNVVLGWTASTDAETPRAGLTYNLKVGTTSGGVEVISPMSLDSGRRLVVGPGEQHHRTQWTLRGLPSGMYTWSVQAEDQGFVGSPFSAQRHFGVGPHHTLDTDADGLPDWYELSYSGNATNLAPGGDPDGDYVLNNEELGAGTDPTDVTSVFMAHEVGRDQNGCVVIGWASVANQSYLLEGSSNLTDFITLGIGIPATPPMNVHTDCVGSAAIEFYRISVE